jgi:hypothetical protein
MAIEVRLQGAPKISLIEALPGSLENIPRQSLSAPKYLRAHEMQPSLTAFPNAASHLEEPFDGPR